MQHTLSIDYNKLERLLDSLLNPSSKPDDMYISTENNQSAEDTKHKEK